MRSPSPRGERLGHLRERPAAKPPLDDTSEKLHPRAAFEHRDFRLFQLARINAIVAAQMTAVAVGVQVWEMTRNPLDLGYIGLSIFLPAVGFSLITGLVADRFDRRLVIFICQFGILLSAALLFLLSALRITTPWPIFGVLFLQGTSRAFLAPASQSLLPMLVPRKHLQNAIVWSSTVFQFGTIVGPGVGGLLLSLTAVSGHDRPEYVYGCAAVMMIVALISVQRISMRTGKMETAGLSLETVFAGVRFIFQRRIILGVMSLDLFAVLLAGATALLPVYAKDILHVGSWGLGILRGSMGVGAAVMALSLAHLPPMKRPGTMMLWCVAAFGLGTILFGLSTNFMLSVAALIVMGAVDMVSVVVRQTLVQTSTPPAMLGRVNAVNLIFIGASNELGEFESGVTARWFGIVPSVVIGGIGSIVIAAIWALRFPELRRYTGREEEQKHETAGKSP